MVCLMSLIHVKYLKSVKENLKRASYSAKEVVKPNTYEVLRHLKILILVKPNVGPYQISFSLLTFVSQNS